QMLRLGRIDPSTSSAVHLSIDKPTDRSSAHAEQCAVVRKLIGHSAIGGVIGYPVVMDVARVVIIIRKEFLEPSSSPSLAVFQEACRVLELKVTSTEIPDGEVIELCLRYTLCVWLEPEWCRVGEALVQSTFLYRGRESPNDRLAKIEVAVSCSTTGDVLLTLRPSLVRMYIIEPWFLSDVASLQFDPKWACCLPKLGKGKIVGVHRRLPADCPFPSWDHIRHYWANAYGYHLPSHEPEAYYDVLFNGMKKTMVYPYYCVCSGEPEEAPFRMAAEAASQTVAVFEATLNRRRATMLGEEVRVAALPAAAAASARLAYASTAPLPFVRMPRKIEFKEEKEEEGEEEAEKQEEEEEEYGRQKFSIFQPNDDPRLHRTIDKPIAKASPATPSGGYGSAVSTGVLGGSVYKPRFGGGARKPAAAPSAAAAVVAAATTPRVPAFGSSAAAARKKAAAAAAPAAKKAVAPKATPATAAAVPTPRRKRAGIKME
ncbi:hypothetical protein PMAYCL1PPCAC_26430, partial [Pristionchus mayeri]